jgi:hypothetical protein
MTILILYTDLRYQPSQLVKAVVKWEPNLTAYQVVLRGIGKQLANRVNQDLSDDLKDITVSWFNKATQEISEIGGVASLDWEVKDDTLLTINYENDKTTEAQLLEADRWVQGNDGL